MDFEFWPTKPPEVPYCKDCKYFREEEGGARGCTYNPKHGWWHLDFTYGKHVLIGKESEAYIHGSDVTNRLNKGLCGSHAAWFLPK